MDIGLICQPIQPYMRFTCSRLCPRTDTVCVIRPTRFPAELHAKAPKPPSSYSLPFPTCTRASVIPAIPAGRVRRHKGPEQTSQNGTEQTAFRHAKARGPVPNQSGAKTQVEAPTPQSPPDPE